MANTADSDPFGDRFEPAAAGSEPVSEPVPVSDENLPIEDDFTGEDLEMAYQRALDSVQTWESIVPDDDPALDALSPSASASAHVSQVARELPSLEEVTVNEASDAQRLSESLESLNSEVSPAEELSLEDTTVATIPLSAAPTGPRRPKMEAEEETRVTPAQVLEAVLFVGGPPMTARKLAGLLRGSNDVSAVERTIDELNQEYAAQDRPYEIRLGDGGYRIDLRPEFERLRLRVFGGGPREVRLSQELLEVLALVAYKQPISVAEIEELGRKGPEAHLRQLLRRELIALRRSDGNPKEVRYHTTSRFLSLFGLGSLEELPQPEDVELK